MVSNCWYVYGLRKVLLGKEILSHRVKLNRFMSTKETNFNISSTSYV